MRGLQKEFIEAITSCKDCKKDCKEKNYYGDNDHSTQALMYLGEIKNSPISRVAENGCKNCDYKSTRIVSILESYGIKDV